MAAWGQARGWARGDGSVWSAHGRYIARRRGGSKLEGHTDSQAGRVGRASQESDAGDGRAKQAEHVGRCERGARSVDAPRDDAYTRRMYWTGARAPSRRAVHGRLVLSNLDVAQRSAI